jgi:hypothetical protein
MCKGYLTDEVTPKRYEVPTTEFDIPAWRALCEGFLKYIEELDLTNFDQLIKHGMDEYLLRGLSNVERKGADIARAATFLINIRPKEKDLYISSICLGDIYREPEDVSPASVHLHDASDSDQ